MELVARERTARDDLARAEREREELNLIGVALSATDDVGALLEMILAKTREITGADAGLFTSSNSSTAKRRAQQCRRQGRCRDRAAPAFQGYPKRQQAISFEELTLPLNQNSLAGYSALHGEVIALDDAYKVPSHRPYRFNSRYDDETGYHTRSLLTLPMKNARGEVIGVLQLLNCKRDRSARLVTPADLDREVQPFAPRAVSLRNHSRRKRLWLTKTAVFIRISKHCSRALCTPQ